MIVAIECFCATIDRCSIMTGMYRRSMMIYSSMWYNIYLVSYFEHISPTIENGCNWKSLINWETLWKSLCQSGWYLVCRWTRIDSVPADGSASNSANTSVDTLLRLWWASQVVNETTMTSILVSIPILALTWDANWRLRLRLLSSPVVPA